MGDAITRTGMPASLRRFITAKRRLGSGARGSMRRDITLTTDAVKRLTQTIRQHRDLEQNWSVWVQEVEDVLADRIDSGESLAVELVGLRDFRGDTVFFEPGQDEFTVNK